MAAVQDSNPYRTAESSPSSDVPSEPYLTKRDTTIDHPLKDVDSDDFETLARYAMMPEGVALAAFSRPNPDKAKPPSDAGLETRKREDSTYSLESLDLDLPPLETYRVETGKFFYTEHLQATFYDVLPFYLMNCSAYTPTVSFPKSPQELRQTLEASGVPLPLEYSSPMSGSGRPNR